MDTTFKGAALRLGDLDIPRIGAEIGVGEDELHAFMDVESAGSGFDSLGRPKMLFEPHLFYARLGAGAKRDAAVAQGLAYPRWGEKPYPSDSYPRLIKAMAIDIEAAIESASWGLTQILGKYYADIGFATPQEMVQAFADHEAEHLEATVKLLKAWKVDDDLRAHRWPIVAETWNGPGYLKNRYAVKLADAFAKWQKIRDTPWPPATAQPATAAPPAPAAPVPAPKAAAPVPAAPVQPVPPAKLKPAGSGRVAVSAGIGALIYVAVTSWWHEITAFVSNLF